MSVLRCSLLMSLAACGEAGPPLSRLTQAWAADTVARANGPLTRTLILAGLAAELCASRQSVPLVDLEVGSALPVSPALGAVLGQSELHSIDGALGETVVLVYEGMDLSDHDVEWLRLTVMTTDEHFQVEFDPLIGDAEGSTEIARLEGFGQISISVDLGCSSSQALVGGSALWVDDEGRRHELKLPADSEIGSDLSFDGAVPWLPVAGAVSWSARIEGQDRSMTTEDAAEILVDSQGNGKWPVTVWGPDWQGEGLSAIVP